MKLIGGGDLEESLRAAVSRRGLDRTVSITGALPRKAALDELQQAGSLILPSFWEGLPMVLLEAMAMQIPVVASAVCGNPEVVEDGRTGFLVTGQDPQAYADALRILTRDLAARAAIVARATEIVHAEYRASVMAERYLSVYERYVS